MTSSVPRQPAQESITTVDGDITAGRLGGDTQIRTVTGDIQVSEATRGTPDLTIHATTLGDITARSR